MRFRPAPQRPRNLLSFCKNGAVVASLLSATIALGAHGIAYYKAQEAKVRGQVVIETRLSSVEQKAAHSEQILEQLDSEYVRRSELTELDKREDERDRRLEHLQQAMDNIDAAITRMALRSAAQPQHGTF